MHILLDHVILSKYSSPGTPLKSEDGSEDSAGARVVRKVDQ